MYASVQCETYISQKSRTFHVQRGLKSSEYFQKGNINVFLSNTNHIHRDKRIDSSSLISERIKGYFQSSDTTIYKWRVTVPLRIDDIVNKYQNIFPSCAFYRYGKHRLKELQTSHLLKIALFDYHRYPISLYNLCNSKEDIVQRNYRALLCLEM